MSTTQDKISRLSISIRQRRCNLPLVDHCCGCVTELKTAAAIIAVLGVVTSPAVSWAFIRHAYVIRVSCFVSTSAVRTDVVDIHLNNVLSFGFGANAGLGPSSCLGNIANDTNNDKKGNNIRRSQKAEVRTDPAGKTTNAILVQTIRWLGWTLLAADIVFIMFSLHFLYSIFRPPADSAAKRFTVSCILCLTLTFIHGMLYVGACVSVGGSFPLFEFLFSIVDVIVWSYFLIVINSYRSQLDEH